MYLKDDCPLPPIAQQWSSYCTREARSWQRSYLQCIQEFKSLIFHLTIGSQHVVDINED